MRFTYRAMFGGATRARAFERCTTAVPFLLPLPSGEGWGEGRSLKKSTRDPPPRPVHRFPNPCKISSASAPTFTCQFFTAPDAASLNASITAGVTLVSIATPLLRIVA